MTTPRPQSDTSGVSRPGSVTVMPPAQHHGLQRALLNSFAVPPLPNEWQRLLDRIG